MKNTFHGQYGFKTDANIMKKSNIRIQTAHKVTK